MKHVRIGLGVAVILGLLVPASLYAQGPVGFEEYLLFSDDFEGGPDPAWQISAGWATEEHSGNTIFVARQGGLAWVQDDSVWPGDYVFRANTRLDYGTVALSFRFSQEARYVVQYTADGLNLLKDYPRGTFTLLAQAAAPALGEWHPITIGCEGPRIQVYLDRTMAIDYTDPAPILSGTVAVGALDETLAGIAYALVMRLPHSLPAGGVVGQPPAVQFSGPPDQPPPVQPGGPEGEPGNPPPAGWPDMVITDVMLSNTTPQVGEIINVWPSIVNQGTVAAENFDVVLIPDYEPGGPNNPGALLPIQTLQPGELRTMELQNLYAQPGQYTLRVLVTNDWYLTGNVEPGGTLQWDVNVTVVGAGEEPPPPPAGQADLIVAGATASAAGQGAAVIYYTAQNIGTADAGAFTVRWHPHGLSDEVGCSEDINFLGAGQSVDLVCNYTYANHGEMHWRVVVDADNDILESNENNNQREGTVQIETGGQEPPPPPAGQADLIVAGATASAAGQGDTVIYYTAQNIGTADAGAFTVRWHPHGLSDEVGCSEDINFLGAGQSVDLVCNYTYANHGEMHWRVVVDADNDIAESNESNNQREGTVQIEAGGQEPPPPPAGQADIVATDVTVRALAAPLGSVDVVITVQNVGTVDAGLFTVEWRPHGISDEVGCSQDLALAAGEAQWVRCLYAYVGHGEMHWRVLLDVDNDIIESNEGNNEARGTVTIEPH